MIDDTATETVTKLLKLGGTDASDKIAKKISTLSPKQAKGVMKILDAADPDAAAAVRAQALEFLLVKSGKPTRGATTTRALETKKLSPAGAKDRLGKNEERLLALFEGDNRAKLALKEAIVLLDRLSVTDGLLGAQTQSHPIS